MSETVVHARCDVFGWKDDLTMGEVVAVECTQTRGWCIADPSDPKKLKSSPVPEKLVVLLRRRATV
jgi:hypothetical protein